LARFDELEEMTPSESVNIESVVDMIVNEAKTDKYQIKGTLFNPYTPAFDEDDEVEFANYLNGLGFELINEQDLTGVSFSDEKEMREYITDKIFENDKNKNVARRLAAGGSTGQMTQEQWNAEWAKLNPGESMVGLDGKTYTKQ
jgi:hypothetical protein